MALLSQFWIVILWTSFVGLNTSADASSITLFSSYHINDKKSLSSVGERFLSFTLEPELLTHVAECGELNKSSNLFRSLVPAYLRIAGPDSNKLLFQINGDSKPQSSVFPDGHENLLIKGTQWLKFIDFVNKTDLRVIVSLNGGFAKGNLDSDLTNALEFITFSNKNNLDLDWELGYELQKISDHNGKPMGRDVSKLRKILEVFPRYQKSLILGPDMTSMESRADIAFVRNYLSEAEDSLDVFTLHYDFSRLKESDSVYDTLLPIFNKMETYLWNRDGVPKTISKGVIDKKSVWMGESETKDQSCSFSDTLSFIHRLGASAKLGASVFLRKPHLMSLYEPTSEYWAAVMYKSLVGKTVLDTRLVNGNNSKVFAFGHCSRVSTSEESIINPNIAYEKGAVTLYGINTGSEWSRFFFRLNSRYEQLIHLYVLTEDRSSQKTLLNRQELHLSDDNELPMVSPKIREYAKYVFLPPKSIFFLVLPYANSRACVNQNTDETYEVLRKNKASSLLNGNDTEVDDGTGLLEEGEVDDGMIYVSFPKKQNNSTSSSPEPKTSKNTKFITYSDDTWLSPLPDQLKEIFYKGQERVSSDSPPPESVTPRKERKSNKIENYRIITQALLGKRNVSQTFEEDINNSRFSRSVNKGQERVSNGSPISESMTPRTENNPTEVMNYASLGVQNVSQNLRSSRSVMVNGDDDVMKDEKSDWDDNVSGGEIASLEDWEYKPDSRRMVEEEEEQEKEWRDYGENPDRDLFLHSRKRRDIDALNSNSSSAGVFPVDIVDNLSDSEDAFSFDSDAPVVFMVDSNDPENVRPSRGIVSDAQENLSIQPHLPGSFIHKSKKSKSTKGFTVTPSVNDEVMASTEGASSFSENVSVGERQPVENTEMESTTLTQLLSSEETSELSSFLPTVHDDSPNLTTEVMEAGMTPEVSLNARSMPEESYDEGDDTAKHADEGHQPTHKHEPRHTLRPRLKPAKLPITGPKHPSGYSSVSSTKSPIGRRHHARSIPANKKRIIKFKSGDSDRTQTSKTLPELIRMAQEKLQSMLEANRARIKALRAEREQKRLLNPDPNVMAPRRQSRSKRNVEKINIPRQHLQLDKKVTFEQNSTTNDQLQAGKSVSEDVFHKAQDVCKDLSKSAQGIYSDVSDSMQEKLRSITSWIEDKYKNLKRDLTSARSEHDVSQMRKRIHDYNEEIRKELAEMRERLRARRMEGRGANVDVHQAANSHLPTEVSEDIQRASRKFKTIQVDLPGNRTFQIRTRHAPASVTEKNAISSNKDADEKNIPNNKAHELHRSRHHSNLNEPNEKPYPRRTRSLESENEFIDDNRKDDSFINSLPVSTIMKDDLNIVDPFAQENVDAKLYEQYRPLDSRIINIENTMTSTPEDVRSETVTNNVHDNFVKGDISPPQISGENLKDANTCERSTNVFAYLWCKCNDFFVVIFRAFDSTNDKVHP